MTKRPTLSLALIVSMILVAKFTMIGYAAPLQRSNQQTPTDSQQTDEDRAAHARQPAVPSAENVFSKASPAVVRIEVRDREFRLIGQGSGFFLSADGLIATNHHVIAGAHFAVVEVPNGPMYLAEGIAGVDPVADLALLKVRADGHPFVELAGPALPQVGARVYAIGNPQGLSNTLSEGLVSGHRYLSDVGSHGVAISPVDTGRSDAEEVTVIQTTASISPGSSGGPLLSSAGRVVGVVTANLAGGQNLNFAVPVRRLIALVRTRGSVKPLASAGGKPLGRGEAEKLQRAWAAIEKEDYGHALRLLASLREQQGGSASYWSTVGTVHYRLGNLELAVDAYQSATRLAPNNAADHYFLGLAYVRQDKTKAAIDALENAARLDPINSDAFYLLGVGYRAIGNDHSWHDRLDDAKNLYSQAVSAFKTVVALEPQQVRTYEHLAGLCGDQSGVLYSIASRAFKAGDYDAWREGFQRSQAWDREAISAYTALLAIEPGSANVYRGLAKVYRSLKNSSEDYASDCLQAGRHDEREDLLGESKALLELSISAYKSAIAIEPDDAETHVNLAMSYSQLYHEIGQDQASEAIKALKSAIAIKPDYAVAHAILGGVYEKLRDYTAAIAAYEAALAFEPDRIGFRKGLDHVRKRQQHDLQFQVPGTWTPMPALFMSLNYLARYRLPPSDGDTEDVVLGFRHCSVFADYNEHSTSDYLKKWARASGADPNRTKVEVLKAGKLRISHFELAGSFFGVGRPRTGRPHKENYAMLAAFVEGPGGPWVFQALGPHATINAARDDFRKVLRSVRR